MENTKINIGIKELTCLIVNGMDGVSVHSYKNDIVYQLLSKHVYRSNPPKSKFMEEWEKMDRGFTVDYPNQFVERFAQLIDKHKADKVK